MNTPIKSPADFGRVAVLMGGSSAERDISLKSGQAVFDAMIRLDIDAYKVDAAENVNKALYEGRYDRAFIALHGRGGEDGQIQAVLSSLDIPFTGSDMTASVLSINKMISKQIWLQQGLPTAKFVEIKETKTKVDTLGFPVIVKPVNEGSSIGMTKVNSPSELISAIDSAAEFDTEVIAEQWIEGEEYTVAILKDKALPVIQLKTPHDFYDFKAKYQSNTTEYLCPCDLSEQDEYQCQQLALDAFKALRMTGWGRVDFMRDQHGDFYLLEINSVPGMTEHSLVPMAAKQAGLSFEQLVWQVLETSVRGIS